jgi:hypothetical protein
MISPLSSVPRRVNNHIAGTRLVLHSEIEVEQDALVLWEGGELLIEQILQAEVVCVD